MIPEFMDGLNLPIGGHFCTVAELEERFTANEHRKALFGRLLQLIRQARKCGFLHALLGGSFPTAKEFPRDLDVTWFCEPGTEKSTVAPECVQLMEDQSDGLNLQYLPYDQDSQPDQYDIKLNLWAAPSHYGFDDKNHSPRGVILLDLTHDDPRLD